MINRILGFLILLLSTIPVEVLAASSGGANRFVSGFQRLLMAPLTLPLHAANGLMNGPPGIGLVTGLLNGTIGTVSNVLGGAFDMAAAAAPLAKYAVFL
jgi:hypothetical protein